MGLFPWRPRSDFQIGDRRFGLVDKMVAIGHARLEARAHAGLQQMFASVIDQGDLALDNENKLIFIVMPVAVGRPCTGSQGREIYPKLRQIKNIPQRPFLAPFERARQLRRVNAAGPRRNGFRDPGLEVSSYGLGLCLGFDLGDGIRSPHQKSRALRHAAP